MLLSKVPSHNRLPALFSALARLTAPTIPSTGELKCARARACVCVCAHASRIALAGDDGAELLAVLTQSPRIHAFTKVMTYIFPLAAIITTIPIFSIIIRYAPHSMRFRFPQTFAPFFNFMNVQLFAQVQFARGENLW